ncbi:MAG TPA: hypothetical protein ENI67_02345 [Gammaproteobacteria bacterium]|nr:hypothetical protein [Gammaproteobacteria bacterium]
MTDQPKALTPQEQLAQEITDALIGSKLIATDKREKLQKKIAAGVLKAEDWSLMIDLATGQDGESDKDGGKKCLTE